MSYFNVFTVKKYFPDLFANGRTSRLTSYNTGKTLLFAVIPQHFYLGSLTAPLNSLKNKKKSHRKGSLTFLNSITVIKHKIFYLFPRRHLSLFIWIAKGKQLDNSNVRRNI